MNRIKNVIRIIKSKRFLLKKHSIINIGLTFGGLAAVVLVLGAFCVRNTVVINDNGAVRTCFSASDNADEILSEFGYTLTAADCRTVTSTDMNEIHINIERGIDATITVNGIKTAELTVKKGEKTSSVLKTAGITLSPNDEIYPAADAALSANTNITVFTAHKITVSADGAKRELYAVRGTLSELFAANNITLDKDDEVNADLNAEISGDINVTVDRVKYIKRVTVEPIPYKTVEVPTANLAIGETRVQTRGANSAKRIFATEKYVNGELVSEEITGTEYVEGTDEVILVGTALATPYSTRESETGALTLVNGLPAEFDYIVSGNATAYTAKAGCGTYSGRPLIIGSVGVDPDLIPFGSELYIVSKDGKRVYGYAVASDTGDMTDIIADCYMGTTAENYPDACRWGLQTVDIYVLKTGDNSVSWM